MQIELKVLINSVNKLLDNFKKHKILNQEKLNQIIDRLCETKNLTELVEKSKYAEYSITRLGSLMTINGDDYCWNILKNECLNSENTDRLILILNMLISSQVNFVQENDSIENETFSSKILFLIKTIDYVHSKVDQEDLRAIDLYLKLFVLLNKIPNKLQNQNQCHRSAFLSEFIFVLLNKNILKSYIVCDTNSKFQSNIFSRIFLSKQIISFLESCLEFNKILSKQIIESINEINSDILNEMISIKQIEYILFQKENDELGSNLLNSFHASLFVFFVKYFLSLESNENVSSSLEKNFDQHYLKFLDLIYSNLDDDEIINFNLFCFNKQIEFENSKTKEFPCSKLVESFLDKNILFVKLMKNISFDYEILIDWLITNETNFLMYFVKYLKYLNHQLENKEFHLILKKFSQDKKNLNDLKKTSELIIELSKKVKNLKKTFPYNCEPLIKLLEKFCHLNVLIQI